MEKLLIIDGSALLFQSFYGMPNKIKDDSGNNIEAVICFFGILNKTIKMLSPNKLLVVFDGENKLARQEINKDYKANRLDYSLVNVEDNPFSQLGKIKKVLDYIKYPYYETINMEADDYIAGVTNAIKNQFEIVISSPDKDFIQLLDRGVTLFTYRGKVSKVTTDETVLIDYGFAAKYFNTYKALVGDKSDNIKGLYKVGFKTASSLIKDYGNLENIIINVNNLKPNLAKLINSNIDMLRDNYKIINLQNTVIDIDDIPNLDYELTNLKLVQILEKLS